jgi:hypothetical protein
MFRGIAPTYQNFITVQRKPKPDQPDEKAPSTAYIVMVSLFGYPGAGHLMLGNKRAGALFAVLFTLASLGVVYEIWYLVPEILKLVRQAVDMQEALTIPQLPNLPRMGLWIALTGAIWISSGVHSAMMAQQVRKDWPAPTPQPENPSVEPTGQP